MLRRFVCLVTVLGLAAVGVCDESKKTAPPKEITLKSTIGKDAKKCACVGCTVNFGKELGVPLEYLSGLGHRVHQARLSPDPVELAMAAQSLAVAEKVAGKKASVTSDQILKEAVALGKVRGISAELAALTSIVSDESVKQELDKEMAAAKTREEENAAALETGEQTRELFGTLTVANHTTECLRIYVSGRYKGTVHAGDTIGIHVHDHNHHTELQAICEHDGEIVSEECVEGHQHRYYWHIH